MLNIRYITVWLLIGLLAGACTGLGGEPEIVATVDMPTPIADVPLDTETEDSLVPPAKPDIQNGALIFAENCTACHGENGNGQGELVLDGSIAQPPDMTDFGQTGLDTPLQWYDIITNGRIENLMPPWKSALSVQDRWDVAFYAYTLSYDENTLELGRQIWENKCADCESVNSLSNLEQAVSVSDSSFGNDVDREDFGNTLSRDEIKAAVAYARSLSVDNRGSIAFIPDEVAISDMPDTRTGTFSGMVVHGTAGNEVPDDTVIQIQYGNASDGFEFAQTTINPDGTFAFEDIPLTNAYTYNVGAVYRDRLFTTILREGHPEDIEYNQTITVYDLTDDPFVISISRIDLFIDPIQVPDVGTGLRVTEIIRYNNSSDRMYTTGRSIGDGREAVLLVQFPVGALITSSDANGRYLIIEDVENVPTSVIDTYPIQPGDEHEVIVEYFVPYTNGAILDQPFTNAIDGEVTITVSNNLSIISEDLTLTEESNTTENLRLYTGNLNIETNPELIFEVAGNPFATTSDDETVVTTDTLFPILLVGVGLVVALVVIVIVLNNRDQNERAAVDQLIKQIAELDDMHDNGQINHDVYQRQRADLKNKLAALMQKTDTPTEST